MIQLASGLTDAQWSLIAPLIPAATGRRRHSARDLVEAALYIDRVGIPSASSRFTFHLGRHASATTTNGRGLAFGRASTKRLAWKADACSFRNQQMRSNKDLPGQSKHMLRRTRHKGSAMLFRCEGTFYQHFLPAICQQREVKRYLEIGVQAGVNLKNIQVEEAIAIDPDFRLSEDVTQNKRSVSLYRMTSDAYFSSYDTNGIDFAFLDGMHMFEFLLRDFMNVEARCRANGLVAFHDCLPFDETMVTRTDNHGAWTGDVWKVIPILKRYRPDLKVILVDAAPTGLVFVTNLDPTSRVLNERYLDIVSEAFAQPNDTQALEAFYASYKVESAAEILADFNQSRFFRT